MQTLGSPMFNLTYQKQILRKEFQNWKAYNQKLMLMQMLFWQFKIGDKEYLLIKENI